MLKIHALSGQWRNGEWYLDALSRQKDPLG